MKIGMDLRSTPVVFKKNQSLTHWSKASYRTGSLFFMFEIHVKFSREFHENLVSRKIHTRRFACVYELTELELTCKCSFQQKNSCIKVTGWLSFMRLLVIIWWGRGFLSCFFGGLVSLVLCIFVYFIGYLFGLFVG